MKLGAWALLAAIMASVFAPAAVVVGFHLRRAYVERELCVQREVAAELRTCHGQCHLAKQLRALEQEAEQGFPEERIHLRSEPMMDERPGIGCPEPPVFTFRHHRREDVLREGHPSRLEPVPWC